MLRGKLLPWNLGFNTRSRRAFAVSVGLEIFFRIISGRLIALLTVSNVC